MQLVWVTWSAPALHSSISTVMLVLGLGLKDKICGLGLVGEKQNFNIVCRLYEKTKHH